MGNFNFTKTPIDGVFIIEPTVYGDSRGFFMETYHQREFESVGIDCRFIQDNHSMSAKGVLRGLHFQTRHPQGKLVRVVSGAVFDVAVDLRPDSCTFGKWYGEILSAENHKQLFIPAEGFAHGFLTLLDKTEFIYKCTDFYDPDSQSGILWNDPELDIKWPVETVISPVLSAKDKENQTFRVWREGIGKSI